MRRTRLATILLGTATVLVVAAIAAPLPARQTVGDITELLDPTRVAASACRKPDLRLRQAQKPIRVAALTPVALAQEAVRIDGLDEIHFPITTGNAEVQRWFDQGLALVYGFNHAEAIRSFRMGQKLDPSCAMCFWGEALAYGPNINAPMEDAVRDAALASVAEAQRLAPGASPKERALIAAQAKRYAAMMPSSDRLPLDESYAEAMAKVAQEYSEDDTIAVLYAESLMNLQPWNYWERDGAPRGNALEILAHLEKVLARNPDHPQAIHLYIHMTEASPEPGKAERFADKLGGLVPGAGHLVHMPSHTYFRIGRYRDLLDVNLAAMRVDESYLEASRVQGLYAQGYYPHNVHFALVSAQMVGDGDNVRHAASLLPQIMSDEVAAAAPTVEIVMTAPYYAEAQFGTRKSVWAVEDPGDRFPIVKAMYHYARAVSSAAEGDMATASGEAAAMEEIALKADFTQLEAGGVPATDILDIARLVVDARIAQAEGDFDAALADFERAAALQDDLAYMEPAYWYYPVRQSLGAALLQAGRIEEAAHTFEAALVEAPNNAWALWGLARARAEMGDEAGAAVARQRMAENWVGDDALLTLSRL